MKGVASEAAARRLLTGLGVPAVDAADEAARLAASVEVLRFQAGEPIEHSDAACVVEEGRVRLYVCARTRELVLAALRPRAVFHFTAAFGVPMPDLRARALTDAVVLAAPGSLVLETLRNHPPALARALAGLAAQTVAVERLLARTAHQGGLRRRIVLLLASLELAAADDRGYRRLVDPPTHAQIAARVGARRETVTRLIARLEAEGVVRRERRGLMLLPTRLRPEA